MIYQITDIRVLSLVCYGPALCPNIRPCITHIYKFIVLCSNKRENIIDTSYSIWYLVVDRIEQEIQCEV